MPADVRAAAWAVRGAVAGLMPSRAGGGGGTAGCGLGLALEVLTQPASCRSASIFASQDVRYVILYRFGHAADLGGFCADPARYRRVFENPSVVIYVPSRSPDVKCHGAG